VKSSTTFYRTQQQSVSGKGNKTACGVLWHCMWCTVTLHRLHVVYCDTAQTACGVLWHCTDCMCTVTLHRLHVVYPATLHRRHQGVPYCLKSYSCTAQIMSFTTIRTMQPSLCWFSQNSQMVNNILYFYYSYFITSWTKQAFYVENSFRSSWQFYWFQFSMNFKTALYSNMIKKSQTVCCLTNPY
jgi:hypothetical protein